MPDRGRAPEGAFFNARRYLLLPVLSDLVSRFVHTRFPFRQTF